MAKEDPGIVYLIECEGFVKIGCCEMGGFERRLRGIEGSNPFPIKVLKTFECSFYRKQEMRLHGMHRTFKVKGEWFKLPNHLLIDLSWFEPVDFQQKQTNTRDEKVNVRITEDEREIINEYCEQEGRSQSDIVREFIRSLETRLKKTSIT